MWNKRKNLLKKSLTPRGADLGYAGEKIRFGQSLAFLVAA